jgi:hypothetical protein
MGMKDDMHDEIGLLAYYRYVKRGRTDGYALEDWLAAEREVSAAHAGDGRSEGKPEKRDRRKTMAPAQSRMLHAE